MVEIVVETVAGAADVRVVVVAAADAAGAADAVAAAGATADTVAAVEEDTSHGSSRIRTDHSKARAA